MAEKSKKFSRIIDRLFPSEKVIRHYISFSKRHPGEILLVAVFITLLGGFGAIHLFGRIDTRLESLLPEHFISVRTLTEINKYGGKIYEHLFVEGKNTEELVRYGERIVENMEKDPNIYRVDIKQKTLPEKENAFPMLPKKELRSIYKRIKKKIAHAKLKRTGFFILFDDEEVENASSTDSPDEDLAPEY